MDFADEAKKLEQRAKEHGYDNKAEEEIKRRLHQQPPAEQQPDQTTDQKAF